MKTTRNGMPFTCPADEAGSQRRRLRRDPAPVLGEALDHHVALQLRNVVDEQLAVEVIDLMLQAGGKDTSGIDLLQLAVPVKVAHADRGRPLDLGVEFGD